MCAGDAVEHEQDGLDATVPCTSKSNMSAIDLILVYRTPAVTKTRNPTYYVPYLPGRSLIIPL